MYFVRYEIRMYKYNYDFDCFDYQSEDFEYKPFDSLQQAINYSLEKELHSSKSRDIYICKVYMFSNSESVEKLFRVE